jgi:folate-dependent phosphoribosylglycinamide formyltransferase PurN
VFVAKWKGRCINVHPSLLPRHAGLMDLAVHASVLAAGDGESGCTVHLVDEVVDAGLVMRVLPFCTVVSRPCRESPSKRKWGEA